MIDYLFSFYVACVLKLTNLHVIKWLVLSSFDGNQMCSSVIWLLLCHVVLFCLAFQEELNLLIASYVMNADIWARIVLKILMESIRRFTDLSSWCLSFSENRIPYSFEGKQVAFKDIDDLCFEPSLHFLVSWTWCYSIWYFLLCPQGGGCKICGGITHLAKDCPNQGNKATSGAGNACKF